MRTKFKAWTEPYINEHPEVMLTLDQLQDFREPFYLEIGSGKGKFLIDMATAHPDLFFIGIERNVTCAGIAAKKLVEGEISNAKLMFIGADEALEVIKDNSIRGIFLNFSDPWPKKRHHKRRLTAPSYLLKYERVLLPEGQLFVKTDNDDMFAFSEENLANSPLKIMKIEENYDGKADFDMMTEYEISFREKGQNIHRIVAKKL